MSFQQETTVPETTPVPQDQETWPDKGEQGHDGCLFNAGAIPAAPVVSASIWVRRSDGVFFFVEHDTRQSAVDYLSSLRLKQAIPDYTEAPTAQHAATSQLPSVFMGGGGAHQVILIKGTTPPPAERLGNLFGGPIRMTKTILLKPSQLMTFVNIAWDDIFTEHIEAHVYRLA